VGAEYGIGAGNQVAEVVLPGPPPAVVTHVDIENLLIGDMDAGLIPPPPAGGDYLYIVYFPASTTVDLFATDQGCATSYGYHYATFDPQGVRITYAAIPDCSALDPDVDYRVILFPNASHEIIEAATNPSPLVNPAYWLGDQQNPWSQFGGEVADECIGLTIVASDYKLTRVWSNAVASDGGDPCQPSPPGEVFYDVTPTPDQNLTIPAGTSLTITLTGWSAAPLAAWFVTAYAGYDSAFLPQVVLPETVELTPPLDTGTTIANGLTTTLTIGVPPNTPSGSIGSVFVDSFAQAPTAPFYSYFLFPRNDWPVLINVP
jgi:hypothetical protein